MKILSHLTHAMWNWLKCTVIQYLVLLVCDSLKYLYWYLLSLPAGKSLRVLMEYHAGGRYTFETGLMLFIPVSAFLFCIWKEIRGSGKMHWSMLAPQLILMILVYLKIALHLEWNLKIITVDEYMLGGWLSSLFGGIVQMGCRQIFKKWG